MSCAGNSQAGTLTLPSLSPAQSWRPGSWRASAASWSHSWRRGWRPTRSCGGKWRSARRWCRRCAAVCAPRSAASWRSCVAAATEPPCWALSCRSTPRRPPTSPTSCTRRARNCRLRAQAPAPPPPPPSPGSAGAHSGPAARPQPRPPPRAPAGTGPPGSARPAPRTTPMPCQTPRSSSTPGGPRGPLAAARASRLPRSPLTKPPRRPRPARPVRRRTRSKRGAGWEGRGGERGKAGPGPDQGRSSGRAGGSQGLRQPVPPPGSGRRRPLLPRSFAPPSRPRLLYLLTTPKL